jgi:hypothetical protein
MDVLWTLAALALAVVIASIITFEVSRGCRLSRLLWLRFRLWLVRLTYTRR